MGSGQSENKGKKQLKSGRGVSPSGPILIGLGANLPSPRHGPPVATLEAALVALERHGIRILSHSRWWKSAPVPASEQPWYVNGAAKVESSLAPEALLACLLEVEAEFGRVRSAANAPRVLDLDLLAYGDQIRLGPRPPLLPHPRLADRAFVLYPLADIELAWRHPGSGRDLAEMIAALSPGQIVRPFP